MTSQFTVFGVGGRAEEYTPVKNRPERMLGVADNWEDRILVGNMARWRYIRQTLANRQYLYYCRSGGQRINRSRYGISATIGFSDTTRSTIWINGEHRAFIHVQIDSHYQLKLVWLVILYQYDFSRWSLPEIASRCYHLVSGISIKALNETHKHHYAADSWQQTPVNSRVRVCTCSISRSNKKAATGPRLSFRYQFNDNRRSYATGNTAAASCCLFHFTHG